MRACAWLACVGLVLSAGSPGFAAPSEKPPTRPATNPTAGKGLDLPFPRLEGWELSPRRPLPDGYTVAYRSEDGIVVTVYVYNRGDDKIPDDLASERVQMEMAGATDALNQMKKLGHYDDVKEVAKAGEAMLGGETGRKSLYARYALKIKQLDAVSEIYVLPYKNYIIKVRSTRPAEGAEKTDPTVAKLYKALGEMVAKG